MQGKQPATGQKKSKDHIAKAASQKKGAKKKWTKGKTKEKADHAVFLEQAALDRMLTGIPKLGKHISVTHVVDKYKVVGSIARMVLRRLVKNGTLKGSEFHGKQFLLTPTVAHVQKPAAEKEGKKEKGKKKEKN